MNLTLDKIHSPESSETLDMKSFFRIVVNEILAYVKKKNDATGVEQSSPTESIAPTTTPEQSVEIKTQAEAVAAFMKQPLMDKVKENKEAFALQLILMAQRLKTKPEWLLAVMDTETAGTMDSSIQNPNTDATGLIQFMPDTARGLGTTTAALKSMSNVDQLVYVEKYLAPMTGKLNSLEAVYLAVFFPAAVAHADEPGYVFEAKGLSAGKVARNNPLFNKNGDQQITMAEFSAHVRNKMVPKIDASIEIPQTYLA